MALATPDAFEQRYLERARAALADSGLADSIEAVMLDRGAGRPGPALAGWWCPPDSPPDLFALPNPWEDRDPIGLYDAYAWGLTQSLLGPLARLLDELLGARPPVYWETLLLPWLVGAVTVVLDRRIYLLTARALAPGAAIVPGDEPRPPNTMLEGIVSFQDERGNASLMTAMAAALGFPLATGAGGVTPAPRLVPRDAPRRRALRDPRTALGLASQLALRLVLGRRRGRQVALLRAMWFSPADVAKLSRRVEGLRVTPAVPPFREDPPSVPQGEHPSRARLAEAAGGDERERLIAEMLPVLLPRSVLEGYDDLAVTSTRRHGDATNLVVGNYLANEVDNEFIARCRAGGRAVAFIQHGGSYMQLRVHQMERFERLPGCTFVSWGARGEGVEPSPVPRLERLKDGHRGGDDVVLVEWVDPPIPYVVTFSTIPMADQGFDVGNRLARFAESVGLTARSHLVLKPFPTFVEAGSRDPALEALPNPGRAGSAAAAMRRARIAVIAYPDTPFIEAVAIGVPTIGLWDPAMWEMREDAAPYFDELERLGVLHSDPTAAAQKLDDVYERADEWWSGADIQSARRRFLDRFATGGDWRREWSERLRALS